MKVNKKFRIAIIASGNGSNTEKIIRYFSSHQTIEVAGVLCNNPGARVLERARRQDVSSLVFDRQDLYEKDRVRDWLRSNAVSYIVLAGFLWLLPKRIIDDFPGRIINIHPALLPKFGGRGMYGMRVHQAVIAAGERQTGITIHLVNEKFDEGTILLQERCLVEPSDTPETLATKVHDLEYRFYPPFIEKWILRSESIGDG